MTARFPVLYFFIGVFVGIELSAMTSTTVFRWLPCPCLRECHFHCQASPWRRILHQVPLGQTACRDSHAYPSRHAAYAYNFILYTKDCPGSINFTNLDVCGYSYKKRQSSMASATLIQRFMANTLSRFLSFHDIK